MSGYGEEAASLLDVRRRSLRADCERCFGLCCVAPAFSASADFAIDKDAGQPCPNLRPDFRCGIHARLREQGFPGCTAYDCFGAGQQVAQVTFGGQNWRRDPQAAQQMFAVFSIMRPRGETERLTRGSADALGDLDGAASRRSVNALLFRASELVRAGVRRRNLDRSGADLIGSNLNGDDLKGASLRGAYLIAADLSGADLRLADLIGADFRHADLSGADLTESIFLTQSQLDAAKGDADTKVPPSLTRPSHWSPSSTQATVSA